MFTKHIEYDKLIKINNKNKKQWWKYKVHEYKYNTFTNINTMKQIIITVEYLNPNKKYTSYRCETT